MKTLTRILVLGKDGQVGKAVLSAFAPVSTLTVDACAKQECDITDKQQVRDVIYQTHPDIVINCAAYTQVDAAEDNEELAAQINIDGPLNIAQVCSEQGAFFIHISTDYVFDGTTREAYKETDTTNPQSTYGHTKLHGEQAVLASCPHSIVLRTSWVFSEHSGNFLSTMLNLAKTHTHLNIVDDQIGGPTAAIDIAHALLKICMQAPEQLRTSSGVFHFSGYPYVSWYGFAQFIFLELANFQPSPTITPIPSSAYPQKAQRPLNSCLSNQKIEAHFAIKPSDWRAAVTQIIQNQYKG